MSEKESDKTKSLNDHINQLLEEVISVFVKWFGKASYVEKNNRGSFYLKFYGNPQIGKLKSPNPHFLRISCLLWKEFYCH